MSNHKIRRTTLIPIRNLRCGTCPCCVRVAARERELRDNANTLGLCRSCPNKPEDGGQYCERCRRRQRKSRNALYHRRKEEGLCVQCGNEYEDTESIMCKRCRADPRARGLRAKKRRWLACKKAGICTLCGVNPVEDTIQCKTCTAAKKQRRVALVEKRRRERAAKSRSRTRIALDAGGGLSGLTLRRSTVTDITTAAVAAGTSASAMAAC